MHQRTTLVQSCPFFADPLSVLAEQDSPWPPTSGLTFQDILYIFLSHSGCFNQHGPCNQDPTSLPWKPQSTYTHFSKLRSWKLKNIIYLEITQRYYYYYNLVWKQVMYTNNYFCWKQWYLQSTKISSYLSFRNNVCTLGVVHILRWNGSQLPFELFFI